MLTQRKKLQKIKKVVEAKQMQQAPKEMYPRLVHVLADPDNEELWEEYIEKSRLRNRHCSGPRLSDIFTEDELREGEDDVS